MVLFLLIIGGIAFYINAENYVKTQNDYKKTNLETVVVFTGALGRLPHGMKIIKFFENKTMFVSGVYLSSDIKALLTYQSQHDQEGISNHINLGYQALDTIGNAKETRNWLLKEGYHSMYLVTSYYHMPRALLVLRRTLEEYGSKNYTIMPVTSPVHKITIWTQFTLIASEYIKYIYTWLFY